MNPNQPRGCKIAFVSEQTEEEECDRIFNAMLRAANIDRSDVWVCNVFALATETKDLAPLVQDKERWALAVSNLRDELQDANPSVVVPLGGVALRALTGSDNISQSRGNIMNDGMFKILPTLHPKFIMAQWKYYSVVIGDFIRAAEEGEFRHIRLPKRELILEPTLEDLDNWWKRIDHPMQYGPISVDIETGWGLITCIGFAADSTTAITVPFVDKRKANKAYWATIEEEVYAWKFVRRVMQSSFAKLGQNFGGYDASWFLRLGIRPIHYTEDTRLLHHAIYPELPKDLAFMGASYGQQGAWKMMRQTQKEKKDD